MMRFTVVMNTLDIATQIPSAFKEMGKRFVAGQNAGNRELDVLFRQMRERDNKGRRVRREILHEELGMLRDNLEDAAADKVPRLIVSAYGDLPVPEHIRFAYEASSAVQP